jgi:hypothetical protein
VLEPLGLGGVDELDECGIELVPLPVVEPEELGELESLSIDELPLDEEPLRPEEPGELEELDEPEGEELDPLIPEEPLLGELDEPDMPLLELPEPPVDIELLGEVELPVLCSIVEPPLDRFMSELLEPANTAVPKVRAAIETVVNNRRFMRRPFAVAIGRIARRMGRLSRRVDAVDAPGLTANDLFSSEFRPRLKRNENE